MKEITLLVSDETYEIAHLIQKLSAERNPNMKNISVETIMACDLALGLRQDLEIEKELVSRRQEAA